MKTRSTAISSTTLDKAVGFSDLFSHLCNVENDFTLPSLFNSLYWGLITLKASPSPHSLTHHPLSAAWVTGKPHTNEWREHCIFTMYRNQYISQHVLFCVWLLLFNIMSVKLIPISLPTDLPAFINLQSAAGKDELLNGSCHSLL